MAGASSEEVLKLEMVRDINPNLGGFEEAPHFRLPQAALCIIPPLY